ncbi:nucleotidyltransferase domain-containing protein [Planctomycetota bacterium]
MEIGCILKEFRESIEQLYGKKLKDIILYGSYARKQATKDSDIDLAVVINGDIAAGEEIDRMIDIVTDINLDYGVLISVYPVSAKDYAAVNSPLLLNLRKEGIPA